MFQSLQMKCSRYVVLSKHSVHWRCFNNHNQVFHRCCRSNKEVTLEVFRSSQYQVLKVHVLYVNKYRVQLFYLDVLLYVCLGGYVSKLPCKAKQRKENITIILFDDIYEVINTSELFMVQFSLQHET